MAWSPLGSTRIPSTVGWALASKAQDWPNAEGRRPDAIGTEYHALPRLFAFPRHSHPRLRSRFGWLWFGVGAPPVGWIVYAKEQVRREKRSESFRYSLSRFGPRRSRADVQSWPFAVWRQAPVRLPNRSLPHLLHPLPFELPVHPVQSLQGLNCMFCSTFVCETWFPLDVFEAGLELAQRYDVWRGVCRRNPSLCRRLPDEISNEMVKSSLYKENQKKSYLAFLSTCSHARRLFLFVRVAPDFELDFQRHLKRAG